MMSSYGPSQAFIRIEQLIRRIDGQEAHVAEQVLADLDVLDLLESCTRDRQVLSAISEDSYIHANGFYRISLPGIKSSQVRIRLHVWHEYLPINLIDTYPDAHNHKWPFASRVLRGGLAHQIIRVVRNEGPYHHFRHVDLGDRYELIPAGRASLEVIGLDITASGTIYNMTPETIHRATPQHNQYCATLVLELDRLSDTTDVFSEPNRHENGQKVPRRLSEAEVIGEMRQVVAVTRGGGH